MQDIVVPNYFYTGNYEKVLSVYPTLAEAQQDSLSYIHERALIASNKKPTTPLYDLLSKQKSGQDVTVSAECNDPRTAVVHGFVHVLKGKYEDAITIVSAYPKDMEW